VKQVSFGSYTLLRRFARGGMAELYLARHTGAAELDPKLVVIKLVSSRYAKDATFAQMFEDEGRIVTTLNHPNIGHVFEMGQVAGQYFLAMEYIHGWDMRDIIRRCLAGGHPVPPLVAVQVGAQICQALDYAHKACDLDGTPLNIIHRDVSPSNIMVDYNGQVKLVDFGIAKAAGRSSLTVPGTIKGKVRYLAPEQVLGKDLDARCDVFTLGTSLWESTVGGHLFSGKKPVEIYKAIAKDAIRRPSAYVQDYPAELERILLRALAQDVEQRYPSARALQDDLEAMMASFGITPEKGTLTEFIRGLFAPEYSAWEEARGRGASLLDHLLSLRDETLHACDLDEVLSAQDERMTQPEPASSAKTQLAMSPVPVASIPTEEDPIPAPTPEAEDKPKKTLMWGAGPDFAPGASGQAKTPAPQPAPQPDQRPAPQPDQQPAPQPDQAGQILRVSSNNHVAVTSGGTVEAVGASSPNQDGAASSRRTMLAVEPPRLDPPEPTPADEDEDRKRTMIDDMSLKFPDIRPGVAPSPEALAVTVAPQIRPTKPDKEDPSLNETRAPEPGMAPVAFVTPTSSAAPQSLPPPDRQLNELLPEPIVARDREELAAKQLLVIDTETETEAEAKRKRTRTGDWAHQATEAKTRAGTHPFFKEMEGAKGRAVEPGGGPSQRRRRTIVTILAAVIGAAVVVLGVWFVLQIRAGRLLTAAPAVVEVKLRSEPSGALVFDAADGSELGRAPLLIPLVAGKPRKVELRLEGYEQRSVVVPKGQAELVVKLKAEAPR
jgi:eukaryotic-like serine/threonine-protein kinase